MHWKLIKVDTSSQDRRLKEDEKEKKNCKNKAKTVNKITIRILLLFSHSGMSNTL